VARSVANESRIAAARAGRDAGDAHSRTNGGSGLKVPVNAARGGVQSVDRAALRTDKHTTAGHRWLCIRAQLTRKPERPLEFQAWDFLFPDARHRTVLIPGVRRVDAPSVPSRPGERVPESA